MATEPRLRRATIDTAVGSIIARKEAGAYGSNSAFRQARRLDGVGVVKELSTALGLGC